MDPNNPGQNAGGPTPDPWAQPQAPAQPQYPDQPVAGQPPYAPPAAPPQAWAQQPGYDPAQQPGYDPAQQPGYDPAQQQYQQPPYGQPPYGQQPYGQPPYGQPWGAPVAPPKSKLPRIALIIGAVVVGIVVLGIVAAMLAPSNAGKVVFTTDAPSTSGAKTCQLGNQVTSVKVGAPVYANIFFKDRLSGEKVTLTLLKDGKVIDSIPYGDTEVNGIDCIEDFTNLADVLQQFGAGSYEFKFTDSHGNVVSDGTLTVTP